MPVMQKIPLQKHADKEERKPQHRSRKYQRKQIVGLQLRVGISDGIAQPAPPHAARTGKQLSDNRSNHGNARRYANADEEIWQRIWQAQFEQHLHARRIMHEEEMEQIFL